MGSTMRGVTILHYLEGSGEWYAERGGYGVIGASQGHALARLELTIARAEQADLEGEPWRRLEARQHLEAGYGDHDNQA